MLLFDAYFDRRNKGLTGAIQVAFALLLTSQILQIRPSLRVLLAGGSCSVLLVSGLRSSLQPGAFRRFRQWLECQPADLGRMSPEEIRAAAFRMHKRARAVRAVLCAGVWLPALNVSAMWHSPSLLYRLGCGVYLAGWLYLVYMLQKGFSRGHLERDPSLAVCLEFCRSHLEGQRDLLRCVWPRLLGPLLAGAFMVLAADPTIQVLWQRIPRLVLAILLYWAVSCLARRRVRAFQRQIDALGQAQKQP